MKMKNLLLASLILGMSATATASEIRTLNEKGVNVSVEKMLDLPGIPWGMSNNYIVGRIDSYQAFRTNIKTGVTEYLFEDINTASRANSVNNKGLTGFSYTKVIDNLDVVWPALWHPNGDLELLHEVKRVTEEYLIDAGNDPELSQFIHEVVAVTNNGDIAGESKISGPYGGRLGVVSWTLNKNGNISIIETPGAHGGFITDLTESGKASGSVLWSLDSTDTLPAVWDKDGNMTLIESGVGKILSLDGNIGIGQFQGQPEGYEQATIFDLRSGSATTVFEGLVGSEARIIDKSGNIIGVTFPDYDYNGVLVTPTDFMLRTKFGTIHNINDLIVTSEEGRNFSVPSSLNINNSGLFTAGYQNFSDHNGLTEKYGVYRLILE